MGIYRYTILAPGIPPIPILPIQLSAPEAKQGLQLTTSAILDTGSDCTLLPIPLLQRVQAQITGNAIKIPVGGNVALAIPYVVGIGFDQRSLVSFPVFGCAVAELGEMPIIGRDLMNGYKIEFDGVQLEFTIF
jgi:hypothetical protein